VPLASDVADYFEPVRKAHFCDLAQRGIRFLRRRRIDARAYTALLRGILERRNLALSLHPHPWLTH